MTNCVITSRYILSEIIFFRYSSNFFSITFLAESFFLYHILIYMERSNLLLVILIFCDDNIFKLDHHFF